MLIHWHPAADHCVKAKHGFAFTHKSAAFASDLGSPSMGCAGMLI
jgi:hypothetical protein